MDKGIVEFDRLDILSRTAIAQLASYCGQHMDYQLAAVSIDANYDELMHIANKIYGDNLFIFDKDLSNARAKDIEDNQQERVDVQLEFAKEALLLLMNRKIIDYPSMQVG